MPRGQMALTRTDFSHRLFEEQAFRMPDALAIESPGDGIRLSYGGVNSRANHYAQYFLSQAVGPESLVGVFLQNSVDRIVLLLAIHKAGGAYVLLDPDYPAAYLSTILDEIPFACIVTALHVRDRLPPQQAPVICLDALNRLRAEQSPTNLQLRMSPSNAAYISFTSGSTGRPKAVVVEFGASANHVRSVAEAYGLTGKDCIPVLASPGFDMTLEDILPSLAVGATIVLPAQRHITGEALSEMVEQARLTVLNLPGSLWHRWVSFLLP